MFSFAEEGFPEFPRFYFLPVSQDCVPGCQVCGVMGCCNHYDRTPVDILRALDKALAGNFDAVMLPENVLQYPYFEFIVSQSKQRALPLILQIRLSAWVLLQETKRMELLNCFSLVNLLVLGDEFKTAEDTRRVISLFYGKNTKVYATIVGRKNTSIEHAVETVRELGIIHYYFYFPYHLKENDQNFTAFEVAHRLQSLQNKYPLLKILPPLGQDIWDPRVDPELGLEPTPIQEMLLRTEKSNLEFSIIIPTYNNCEYVYNTVRHLLNQSLPRHQYEIILVDDGSTDQTMPALQELVEKEAGHLNFIYLRVPRKKKRAMGDANYRAGIARNVGARFAHGRYIQFLDSDILTPHNFLEDALIQHRKFDVIQCVRLNLREDCSSRSTRYEDIKVERDTFFTDGDYWQRFYSAPVWMNLPYFWKYTCTYGLSLSREVFESIGRIKRNFVFYGFEDTELGYRLAKLGYKFHLNPIVTYHLFHKNERSEFGNSDLRRQRLLATTAKIFYLNCLNRDVFDHFQNYLTEGRAEDSRLLLWVESLSWRLGKPYHWIRQHGWKLKMPYYRFKRWVWDLSFPIRKIYYFTAYQVQTRILGGSK